jgi:hypothetical protein
MPPLKLTGFVSLFVVLASLVGAAEGVKVRYRLPVEGELPTTYRVTLAVTPADEPEWVVSTFLAGAPRTVKEENGGEFTETWNGLDDNHMPVPPGQYHVKGIYMPARKWEVDGRYHTLIPHLVGGPCSWTPAKGNGTKVPWLMGHGFGAMNDIVAQNRRAVFYHHYLENARNTLLLDLTKPIGYDQCLKSYPSGGAAGGTSVATDGSKVWCYSTNGSPNFIHRASTAAFGKDRAQWRRNVYVPDGPVTDMTARRDKESGRSYLYVAQAGEVNSVLVLDGENAEELGSIGVPGPRAVMLDATQLYVLHREGERWTVSSLGLKEEVVEGQPERLFALPDIGRPSDCQRDSAGNFYVAVPDRNQVYKLSPEGQKIRGFGRGTRQKPGHYDPHVFMRPKKLALWTDPEGRDRLLVLEHEGANRISEWSTEGELIRRWVPVQRTAVNGAVALDPADPRYMYVLSSAGRGLVRFRINYEGGPWTIDAVWPDICRRGKFPGGRTKPFIINRNGQKYMAFARTKGDTYGVMVYRKDGDRWVPSAALLPDGKQRRGQKYRRGVWWHDANSDGQVQEDEQAEEPAGLPFSPEYHGETWLDDLSLCMVPKNNRGAWRLVPADFDEHGNPIFAGAPWEHLFDNPVLQARAEGKADALHGGNEIYPPAFGDWSHADGLMEEGFVVNYRGGAPYGANKSAQHKICRYVPDPEVEGFRMQWRVGRVSFGLPRAGEIISPMRPHRPVGGLIGVMDASWATYHVYTEDGLWVESLFPHRGRFGLDRLGTFGQPGEHFHNGFHYLHPENGKVYVSIGKVTPYLFEVENWTGQQNPVRRLTTVQETVRIRASQIARPPEEALRVRGGAGKAPVAKFYPATGGVALDGSMAGWGSADPVIFRSAEQQVRVRCMYDPDHLYLRWHVRTGTEYEPQSLADVRRLFTHDREGTTVSFYLQADPDAPAGGPVAGRPGDVRFVFGLSAEDGRIQPRALGLYPEWSGPGEGHSFTYGSPVGEAAFEHVGPVESARTGHRIDEDGKGFVLAAALPRKVFPDALPEFSGDLKTMVDFSATIKGHSKFWWANMDGSAGTETYDEPSEARLYPGAWAQVQFVALGDKLPVQQWQVCGPWGGPELKDLKPRPRLCGEKRAVHEFFRSAEYPPDDRRVDLDATYRGPRTMIWSGRPLEVREHTVRWREKNTPGRSAVLRVGGQTELHYAATWIYLPTDCELRVHFHTMTHNVATYWINGRKIHLGWGRKRSEQKEAVRTVEFDAGWNKVFFRGYCYGYALRAGLTLEGPEELLWKVKTSATPPDEK